MAERVRVAIRNENEKPEILHESQPPPLMKKEFFQNTLELSDRLLKSLLS